MSSGPTGSTTLFRDQMKQLCHLEHHEGYLASLKHVSGPDSTWPPRRVEWVRRFTLYHYCSRDQSLMAVQLRQVERLLSFLVGDPLDYQSIAL